MRSVLLLPTPSWSSARVAVSTAAEKLPAAPGNQARAGSARSRTTTPARPGPPPRRAEAECVIANGHVRNALAELVDDARRFVAHGLRELLIHQALAFLPVARVDAGGAHRNRTWPGPGCGSAHRCSRGPPGPESVERDGLDHWLRSRLRVPRSAGVSAVLGELSRRDKRGKLCLAWRERAPGSSERQRGQRSRGELTVGKLGPTPDQLNGQVSDRWLVPDQHHLVHLVGHATQALKQLGGRRAVKLALDLDRAGSRHQVKRLPRPACRGAQHQRDGSCARGACAPPSVSAASRPRGASGRS